MKNKAVSGIMLTLLLTSMLTLASNIQPVRSTQEPPAVEWSQTYGGTGGDWATFLIQTNDGGYGIGGSTTSYGSGDYDFYLVRTDSLGSMQWNKTYGGTNYDYAYSVVETSDGGYALAGYTREYDPEGDFWLVRTDSSGNMLWNRTYGGANGEFAKSVVGTSDGGYALAGRTSSYGAGSYDFWLVKTTPETPSPPPIPEFPLGSALPIAVFPLLLYLWWKRKQKTPS